MQASGNSRVLGRGSKGLQHAELFFRLKPVSNSRDPMSYQTIFWKRVVLELRVGLAEMTRIVAAPVRSCCSHVHAYV